MKAENMIEVILEGFYKFRRKNRNYSCAVRDFYIIYSGVLAPKWILKSRYQSVISLFNSFFVMVRSRTVMQDNFGKMLSVSATFSIVLCFRQRYRIEQYTVIFLQSEWYNELSYIFTPEITKVC